MLDYLVDGLVIVAVIYGVVTICYWTYKFHQTWQKVKDDDGNPSEVKTLCHPELIISNENEDQKHDRKSI